MAESANMNSVGFGWECNYMNNTGANMGMTVNREITITGVQADCSIMSLNATVGACQVLFDCVMFPKENMQGPPPQLYLGGPPSPDFSFDAANNIADGTGGYAHGGCGAPSNRLFCAIAKIWSPSATSRLITMPMNIAVPAGAQILFHMDQQGIPCDAEMQGIFFYEYTQGL